MTIEELIQKMKDDVDERSESGELDRHDCQYIAEKYMKMAFKLKESN